MDLAMRFTGRPFVEVASEIDSLLGNKKFDQDEVKPAMTDAERLSALRGVAALTTKTGTGFNWGCVFRHPRLVRACLPPLATVCSQPA